MTRRRVDDGQYGKLQRKLSEVARRIDEGSLDYYLAMDQLQGVIEGSISGAIRNGGFVLSEPIEAAMLTYSGRAELVAFFKEHRGVNPAAVVERLSASFPKKNTSEGTVSVRLAYFGYFGHERQPGTMEMLKFFAYRGLRAATPLELLSVLTQLVKRSRDISNDVIALDTGRMERTLQIDFTKIGGITDVLTDQPWWPYCFKFAVVQL